ncbi:MAG: sodium/proline symporter PutP [Clostridia bacterium]|nr:sodium/proline symporter PutP [Clostridia bacterium]
MYNRFYIFRKKKARFYTLLNPELIVLIVYFAAMLGIGAVLFFRSKSKSDKDYFLGGKTMGPWVTAMSAQASDMSAWLLMGLPGSILAFGLGQAWIGIGLAIGTALNWILVARRLRRFSEAANDSITLPQYLSNRFATKNKSLQVTCAVVFLVCFTLYVASAFVAGADVFTSLFEIDRKLAMLIFATILIIYTFLGGYKAVCWTDFFQGILMLVAVLAVPIIIVITKDLNADILNEVVIASDGTEYSFIKNLFSAPLTEIASGLAWGLGYFGMPHILVRFMAIKKASMVKKSATVAIIWVVLALVSVIFIAVFGRMLIGEELLAESKQSMVFVELARDLFPPVIAGVLLAAIIAASMSTADSQLLVASSSFTSDIYKPIIRKKASDTETLWVGRGVVILVSVVAYFIASSEGQGAQAIMNLVSNAWAGFGSAFGSVVILSLFWRRFTYKGALAGVIAGAVTDVVWLMFFTNSLNGTLEAFGINSLMVYNTGIYELIPGFAVSMIAAIVVTLIDKAPSKEITDIFDTATAPIED